MILIRMKRFVNFTNLTIFIAMLEFISPAFAQNVFPITIGGQEKIYVDSNDVEGKALMIMINTSL